MGGCLRGGEGTRGEVACSRGDQQRKEFKNWRDGDGGVLHRKQTHQELRTEPWGPNTEKPGRRRVGEGAGSEQRGGESHKSPNEQTRAELARSEGSACTCIPLLAMMPL